MEPKRKQKLVVRLVAIALMGAAIIAVALTLMASMLIDNAYEETVEEELKACAELLSDTYQYAYSGDWGMDAGGNLTKGDVVLNDRLIDDVKAKTGVDFAFFYGDTRVMTSLTAPGSSKKLVGAQADPKVSAKVLKGEEIYERGVVVGGVKYDAFFIPERNADGSIVGMIAAERDATVVAMTIRRSMLLMTAIAVVVFLIIVGVGVYYARTISPVMEGITKELRKLADGNLNISIQPEFVNRRDELGDISECVQLLDEKLGGVIHTAKQMAENLHDSGTQLSSSAEQASEASKQVTDAIDEISRGAVSQAESVQDAAGNTTDIGVDVDTITDNVTQLTGYAEEMRTSCDGALEALKELISQSEQVKTAVGEIGNTIHSTNESARSISEFTEAITQIAAQTNLLSLNAAIEAARAGESGKGFAVVASEIGQLAVQSSQSAERIGVIVEKLVSDAEASVEVMQRLGESFDAQETHLNATRTEMSSMQANVVHVAASSANIEQRIRELNAAKDNLGTIVSDLSAVSEENAASTEETNASMEELNATFSLISASAGDLQRLAQEMAQTIGYFRSE